MKKRYDQLKSFVRCGMVPTFVDGMMGDNPVIGHGRLNSVWLAGLVNPEALLAALRQEKAVVSQCTIDDVSITEAYVFLCLMQYGQLGLT